MFGRLLCLIGWHRYRADHQRLPDTGYCETWIAAKAVCTRCGKDEPPPVIYGPE